MGLNGRHFPLSPLEGERVGVRGEATNLAKLDSRLGPIPLILSFSPAEKGEKGR